MAMPEEVPIEEELEAFRQAEEQFKNCELTTYTVKEMKEKTNQFYRIYTFSW